MYSVLLKIINFVDVFLKYSVQCELVKNDSEIVTYCELMNELFYTYPKMNVSSRGGVVLSSGIPQTRQ